MVFITTIATRLDSKFLEVA